MPRLATTVVILAGLLSAQGSPAFADDTTGSGAPETALTDPDGWRFRVALYGWAPSVAGSVTARGQTVDVNASFIQILQKSDSLLGYMGYFEADKGKVGFYLDTVWPNLGFASSSTSSGNPVAVLQILTAGL